MTGRSLVTSLVCRRVAGVVRPRSSRNRLVSTSGWSHIRRSDQAFQRRRLPFVVTRSLSAVSRGVDGDLDLEDARAKLSADDELMIDELIKYKETYGDCHVPVGTGPIAKEERKMLKVSEDLDVWIRKQRTKYQAAMRNSSGKPIKEADQILFLVLDSLGFMWSAREAKWQRSFNQLEAHKAATGSLVVHRELHSKLWNWTDQQRKAFNKDKLSEDRVKLLEEIGFVFDVHEAAWWSHYERLCQYAEENGDARVPHQYEPDPPLGLWVHRMRRDYSFGQLSSDRIMALEAIGFSWSVFDESWEQYFNELVEFHKEYNHTRVPRTMGSLWNWVDRQRRLIRAKIKDNQALTEREGIFATLEKMDFDWIDEDSEERTKRLMELTFSVEVHEERWLENYDKLCDFRTRHGHLAIPPDSAEFQELNSWVKHQRFLHKRGKLALDRIERLDAIKFPWTAQVARWDLMYERLIRFQEEHGHLKVPTRNVELYRWLRDQKRKLSQNLDDTPTESDSGGEMKRRLAALQKLLDT